MSGGRRPGPRGSGGGRGKRPPGGKGKRAAGGRGRGPSGPRSDDERGRGSAGRGSRAGGRDGDGRRDGGATDGGGTGRGARGRAPDRGAGAPPGGRGAASRPGAPDLPRDVWRDHAPSGRRPVVGLVRRRGRLLVAEPLFGRGELVVVERGGGVREGRIGVFVPPRRGGRRNAGHRLVREVGRPDVARDVLEALLLDRGLPRRVARSVAAEAEGVAQAPPAVDVARRDLRDTPTFTIDPASARDFDDAISAERVADDVVRIHVHVADVSAFVRPGGALDGDARWRGTSVYVPGTVEPMLPERLSNGACSLVPGEDRLAVSVAFEVDGAGAVRRASVERTLIRSDARLEYDQVDEIFAGTERATDPWATPLALARQAAAALQRRRDAGRLALEVESQEPRFVLDEEGHVTGVAVERSSESHRLIEHLMVAANAEVARLLERAGAPALHRVHEAPDPGRVGRLAAQLRVLGLPAPTWSATDGQPPEGEAPAAVAELSRLVADHVRRHGRGAAGYAPLVLRALQQARYLPDARGHAGLALEHYCHFTSPIRRYPDLVDHRAVLALVGGGEAAFAGSRSQLEELATWCSATEREAMDVERHADRIAAAFLLERELLASGGVARAGARLAGEVTGVASAGAFVRFGDDGAHEGLLPLRELGDDWWELDELGVRLVGSRSGATVAIGDPIDVRIERLEPARGRVTLALARRR
ncbi:RNB domain-containing ribonuclease [Patulibacter brassicae]|uniref:RNB domain-containing ribonuclease n=1 Tax=Patulibacter brassicae TaxID=1705717 RepID=A0ABU4VL15_9ACTN|nr:RNB domain-containing ribonuclease [Patulibacter brassicae]MDX8151460.1 RNB domain-containing ribonuclease [Patulibacter brassicae]